MTLHCLVIYDLIEFQTLVEFNPQVTKNIICGNTSPKRFFNRFDTWMLQIPHYHVEALGRKLAQRLTTVITEMLSVEKRKLHDTCKEYLHSHTTWDERIQQCGHFRQTILTTSYFEK